MYLAIIWRHFSELTGFERKSSQPAFRASWRSLSKALAVLAYWIVSVTKYRLKLKEYPNIRWDEIMRIAQAQVVVTAEVDTEDGHRVTVRQSTEAEEELAKIYSLLNPIGKVKSMVHPKAPPKNPPPENQGVM